MSQTTAPRVAPEQMLRTVIEDLGLEHRDLRDVFRIDQRTLDRWLTGEVLPQRGARTSLNALNAMHAHLGETFETMSDAREWLRDPSRYLGGLTPLEALRVGRVDRVEAALKVLDAGVFL